MLILSNNDITNLDFNITDINNLVYETILNKNKYILPAKISLKTDTGFFNTMPCIVDNLYSCKIVIRNNKNNPSLSGNIYIYDINTSELIAMLDSKWITSIRTGSIAANTVKILGMDNFENLSLIGLGECMYAFTKCLLNIFPKRMFKISLMKYKNHCEKFINYFGEHNNLQFTIVDNNTDFIQNADIIVSAVTDQTELFTNDVTLYKPGCLIIPIQTKGFQNCDTVFDKVFVDDDNHVKCFQNYGKFKSYNELTNVLLHKCKGRESNEERILAYNIGLAIHDNIIASNIVKNYIQKMNRITSINEGTADEKV